MKHRCSNCGFTATVSRFFRKEKGGLFNSYQTVCEACTPYQATRFERRTGLRVLIAPLVWGLLVAQHLNEPNGVAVPMMIMAIVSIITSPLGIFIHEAGHALCAKALGCEIFQAIIGTGPESFTFNMAGIRFEFCRYDYTGGFVVFSSVKGKWVRTQTALIIASGPLANLIVSALSLYAAYMFNYHTGWEQVATAAFIGFSLSQALMGFGNLIPRKSGDDIGLPSDGQQLLNLLRMPPETNLLAEQVHRVIGLTRQKRYLEAAVEARKDIWTSPLKFHFVGQLMNALSRGEGDRAVIDFYFENRAALNGTGDASADAHAGLYLVHANVAWSAIKFSDPSLYNLADKLSDEALKAAPENPETKGTRGAWLVVNGETRDGLVLLSHAVRTISNRTDKAEFCTFMARGYRQIDDAEKGDLFDELSKHLMALA